MRPVSSDEDNGDREGLSPTCSDFVRKVSSSNSLLPQSWHKQKSLGLDATERKEGAKPAADMAGTFQKQVPRGEQEP